MEDELDGALLQRVREAILGAGGVPVVSERTGIPKKTLEKYLAKKSMPSLANAAKIADAAGISIATLTGEPYGLRGEEVYRLSPSEIAQFTLAVLKEVRVTANRVYTSEGVTLAVDALAEESQGLTEKLLSRVVRFGDLAEARALLPWLETHIRQTLKESRDAGRGTGKREVS